MERPSPLRRLGSLPAPLLLAPASLWYIAFFPVPPGAGFGFSFLTSADFGGIEFKFSLDNYPQLLRSAVYLKVFGNTLIMAFSGTVLCLLIGFPLAYFLATRAARFKNLLLVLLIVPFWTRFLTRADSGLSLL